MMQTPKVRGNSSAEAPLKVSPRPRAARQLKASLDTSSPNSSNQKSRTPKEGSPAVADRKSPRGSVVEIPKKLPSKVSQLESQIAELQLDLSKVKEQLCSSEKLKQQALREAEESQKHVSALSLELEDSKKKFQESFSSEEARSIDFQKISEKREQEWKAKYDALQVHHSADFAALGSAMEEIQRLKSQLEIAAQTVPTEANSSVGVAVTDTNGLEEKLVESLSVVEDMKKQLKEFKDSEANAHALATETLIQLETARAFVETLQLEGRKSSETYNTLAQELDESKGHIKALEELVCKLKVALSNSPIEENEGATDVELETLKEQLRYMKSEVDVLTSAQETAEVEELVRSTVHLNGANEQVELVKSESIRRETDLEVNLEALKSQVAELKANLMDKETELQCIIEQNESLNMKIQDATSSQKEAQLEKELMELKETVIDLKANLMDKETEFQNILEENETLKMELKKKETDIGKEDSTVTELVAAKTAEREAMLKLESLKEEADRSSKRATRVAEQLGAAQAANTEMEAELRKIKVQSDQWRKAAEVAASMLTDANTGNLTDRNGSTEGKFSTLTNGTGSPYSEDLDEDSVKKRNGNGNVLKKFGLSWKKNQK